MKTHRSRTRSALRVLMLALPLAAAVSTQAQAQSCGYSPQYRLNRLFTGAQSYVTILAHRGSWGTYDSSQNLIPENSTGAMRNAGCFDGMELDVKMTSDNVPVLMHDYNLGRTTNVYTTKSGATKFSPETGSGYNPLVSALNASTVRGLHLLLPNRSNQSLYNVPSVQDALNYWTTLPSNSHAPIIFDVKTVAAARAVNAVAKEIFMSPGDIMAMKVNATLYQSRAAYTADVPYLKGIPVFTTNMLSTINIDNAYKAWVAGYTDAVEVNVKSTGGILQGELNKLKSTHNGAGVFNALPDYPGGGGRFYKNDGTCCYTLADLYYTDPNGVKETSDQRGNSQYLKNQGFTFITTDNPGGLNSFFGH